jgi:hypothetical protein
MNRYAVAVVRSRIQRPRTTTPPFILSPWIAGLWLQFKCAKTLLPSNRSRPSRDRWLMTLLLPLTSTDGVARPSGALVEEGHTNTLEPYPTYQKVLNKEWDEADCMRDILPTIGVVEALPTIVCDFSAIDALQWAIRCTRNGHRHGRAARAFTDLQRRPWALPRDYVDDEVNLACDGCLSHSRLAPQLTVERGSLGNHKMDEGRG